MRHTLQVICILKIREYVSIMLLKDIRKQYARLVHYFTNKTKKKCKSRLDLGNPARSSRLIMLFDIIFIDYLQKGKSNLTARLLSLLSIFSYYFLFHNFRQWRCSKCFVKKEEIKCAIKGYFKKTHFSTYKQDIEDVRSSLSQNEVMLRYK